MNRVRRTSQRPYPAILLLLAVAICIKALLPSGFMPAQGTRTIAVALCEDASGGGNSLHRLTIPSKGGEEPPGKPRKGECPFGALSMASLAGPDPVVLALGLAFIVALGFAPVRAAMLPRVDHLRPPLRGPPLIA